MSLFSNDLFLFKDFSEPAFIIDSEGTILEANTVFINRFFSELVDVHGMNVFELISNVFHDPVLSVNRKAMVDRVFSTGEHVIFDDVSKGHIFRNALYPIKNPEGDTTRLLILVHDVTAQVEAEKQARKTDRVYKALLDAIPGSVFVLDEECLIHTCNDYAFELFGDYNGKIPQNNFFNLIFSADRSRITEMLTNLFDSGYVDAEETRMYIHNNDRRYNWFSIHAQRAVIDNRHYLVAVCIDINDRKNDESRLVGYKEWMNMAMEAGNTGIWDWNVKTDEALWSNTMWELFGIEKASGLYPSFELWETTVHPDDRDEVVGALREALNTIVDLNIEYRIVHPDGSTHWILVNGKPICDSYGEVGWYCGIATDITDHKLLEEDIVITREHVYQALEKLHIGWFHLNLKDYSVIRTLEHARIFGYETLDAEWSFDVFLKHIVDEDRERVKKYVTDTISKNKDFVLESQIKKANGEIRRIWASVFIQYDNHGEATHILGMVQDITDLGC
jgi:PAS domain S-box-containing protein